jgi:hypothetical protein
MAKLRGTLQGNKGIASRLSNVCITSRLNSYNYEIVTQMVINPNGSEGIICYIKDYKTGNKVTTLCDMIFPESKGK